jgi:hypothetical protein
MCWGSRGRSARQIRYSRSAAAPAAGCRQTGRRACRPARRRGLRAAPAGGSIAVPRTAHAAFEKRVATQRPIGTQQGPVRLGVKRRHGSPGHGGRVDATIRTPRRQDARHHRNPRWRRRGRRRDRPRPRRERRRAAAQLTAASARNRWSRSPRPSSRRCAHAPPDRAAGRTTRSISYCNRDAASRNSRWQLPWPAWVLALARSRP